MFFRSASTTKPSQRWWVVSAILLAAVLGWMSYEGHSSGVAEPFPKSHMDIVRADGTKASFDIEVATTPEQQERGLMFRQSLAPNAGMLFLWSADQEISMWMKNTFIPLDMLFVAHDGHIAKIITHAVPHDLTPLPSDGPVRVVIEIGGGEASRQNINVGDKVLSPAFSPQP